VGSLDENQGICQKNQVRKNRMSHIFVFPELTHYRSALPA
jgi:hypothetical protein